MDYYNRTVFEWVTDRIGAQSTIAGGGATTASSRCWAASPRPPRFGWAWSASSHDAGFGRAAAQNPTPSSARGRDAAARPVAWASGFARRPVVRAGAGGSFKSQMKKADASGARFAIILGDDEVAAGKLALSPFAGSEQVLLTPKRRSRAFAAPPEAPPNPIPERHPWQDPTISKSRNE